MLLDLKQDVKVGDSVIVILSFRDSGNVTVEAEVRAP
ncbi:MAG: copper chaperone PCu(A)C [SAR202 cluster bacterium]|nr:copper chaperone PCu(A)C [SAR202 cluster bacterium]